MDVSNQQIAELVNAADLRLRILKEEWFPPTWFRALRAIVRPGEVGGGPPLPSPRDVADFLLTGEPNTPHADRPEESLRVWLRYRADFPRLLCLYEAFVTTGSALLLVEPESEDEEEQRNWKAAAGLAMRVLVARSDYQVAMIALSVADEASRRDR